MQGTTVSIHIQLLDIPGDAVSGTLDDVRASIVSSMNKPAMRDEICALLERFTPKETRVVFLAY